MKRDAEEILKDALTLPSDARAALAAALIQSLDGEDEDAEAAWATEVQRRVAELDAGEVSTVPWAEVRRMIFERSRHRALKRLDEGLDLQWLPTGSRDELHRR
jgi:putative addiction module component (TIGR02574 family)